MADELQVSGFVWSDDEMTLQDWGAGGDVVSGGLAGVESVGVPCAWCLREAGIEPLTGTHGICQYHSDLEYQRYQAARAGRRMR